MITTARLCTIGKLAVSVTPLALAGCLKTELTCEEMHTCPDNGELDEADADAAPSDSRSFLEREHVDASVGDAPPPMDSVTLPIHDSTSFFDASSDNDSSALEGARPNDASDGGGDGRCNTTLTVATEPCLISELYGVFVAPQASDGGDGTRSRPYRTLAEGLQRAREQRKWLYVCDDGTGYTEQITISDASDGLQVFGGFNCSDWTYSTARRSRLTAAASPVVTIVNVASGTLLADMDILAPDGGIPGASSVAIVAAESSGVVLRRVKAKAGIGRHGSAGENGGGPSNQSAPNGATGNDGAAACAANPNLGGARAVSTCGGSIVGAGGKGGEGAVQLLKTSGGDGDDGTPDTPPYVAGRRGTGEPTTGTWSCSTGNGQAGDNGTDGTLGRNGTGLGTLNASGWTGGSGTDGTAGLPGQGGGGGGGAKAPADANACALLDGGAPTVTGASGGSG